MTYPLHVNNVASTFTFHMVPAGEEGFSIIASNGPITIRFKRTNTGLIYDPHGSNVTLEWPHMPAVAIAAGQFNRRN